MRMKRKGNKSLSKIRDKEIKEVRSIVGENTRGTRR